jgi:Holliday junction resolvase RusA-like endonuclease
MEYRGKIPGAPVSKSNAYRIITVNGHGSLAKSAAMKKYEECFLWHVGPMRGAKIDRPFELYLSVWFPSKRSDLDGCLKGILDCLQTAKVIKNDNNCCRIVAEKFIDKDNPRVEFTIRTLE